MLVHAWLMAGVLFVRAAHPLLFDDSALPVARRVALPALRAWETKTELAFLAKYYEALHERMHG